MFVIAPTPCPLAIEGVDRPEPEPSTRILAAAARSGCIQSARERMRTAEAKRPRARKRNRVAAAGRAGVEEGSWNKKGTL